MAVEIQPNGQASEETLAEIEQELGHELPPDYRDWLRTTNGGFIPGGATLPTTPMYLSVLVAATEEDGDSPLLFEREADEYLTEDYLPLNEVDAGLLALKLTDPDRGSVWHLSSEDMGLEYDYRAAGYDSEQAYICARLLERVADSFIDLLNLLTPAGEVEGDRE